MLHIKPVNRCNTAEILALSVGNDQTAFVASNQTSLDEAQTAISGGGHAFPFGIYEGDLPVGFLMIGYSTDEHWESPPVIAEGNYNLWRLMIDKRFQGNGYGKQALQLALNFIRQWPCGKAAYCWLSYYPKNSVAKSLYHSFGFLETEETDGDEIIAALKL